MNAADRMRALLEEMEEGASGDPKVLVPQLVLAMDAVGMDPGDEGHQQMFIAMLKKLITNKSALTKAMKSYNASRAAKALKVAKMGV